MLHYKQTQTNRQVWKIQLRFRFWSPRRNLFSDPLRNRNPCLGRDPYYGNHWLESLNLFQSVDLYHLIAYFTPKRWKVRCVDEAAVPAGMARKQSYHHSPDAKNQYPCFNVQLWIADSFVICELQTALLYWLCKTKKNVVVSLHNFLFILISRSLPNLKQKYTTAFRHKLIHNCVTQS